MKVQPIIKLVVSLFITASVISCSSDKLDDQLNSAQLQIKISATESVFDAVLLDFKEIHLKVIDDESDPNCWWKISGSPGLYNLNDLTAGNYAAISDGVPVPTGLIYEIKIVLGDNNLLVKDGEQYPLFTNIIQQENLQMRVLKQFDENSSYAFEVEFDALRSIIEGPISDQFILRPIVNFRFK